MILRPALAAGALAGLATGGGCDLLADSDGFTGINSNVNSWLQTDEPGAPFALADGRQRILDLDDDDSYDMLTYALEAARLYIFLAVQGAPGVSQLIVDLPVEKIRTHAGDIDGDGDMDPVVIGTDPDTGDPAVAAVEQTPTGEGFSVGPTLSLSASLPVDGFYNDFEIGETDGDGAPNNITALSTGGGTYFWTGRVKSDFSIETLQGFALPAKTNRARFGWVPWPPLRGGDGPPDMAITIESMDQVWVFPNNGDGTFVTPSNLPESNKLDVGSDPSSVAVGDLDGDGAPDLVVGNDGSDDLSVLLNNGDNTFAPETRYGGAPGTLDVDLADFDGDGDLDVVSANAGFPSSVTLHLNDGAGALSAPAATVEFSGLAADRVRAFDADGDGNTDAHVQFFSGERVRILFGDGDGGFLTPRTLESDNYLPTDAELADVTGDGAPDLLLAAGFVGFETSSLVVRAGDGDGGFGPPATLEGEPVQRSPRAIETGDFDGDGATDAVIADSLMQEPDVYLNDGGGAFSPVDGEGDAQFFAIHAAATGDLDGDGDDDLALITGLSSDGRNVETMLSNGDGTFSQGVAVALTDFGSTTDVAIGDLDGDGAPDVAASRASGPSPIVVLFNDGDGGFPDPPVQVDTGASAEGVAIADVDEDGDGDLLVPTGDARDLCPGDAGGLSNAVIVLRSDGSGGFAAPEAHCLSGMSEGLIALADAENDGDVDVFSSGRGVSALINDGSGTFYVPVGFDIDGEPDALTLGDVNGDGLADVAALIDGEIRLSTQRPAGGEPAEPADLNGDGEVGTFDLGLLISDWGDCPGCAADLTGDGVVNTTDLGALIAAWGEVR